MYIPNTVLKYMALGTTGISVLFSGLHYGSHGFIALEQYSESTVQTLYTQLKERYGLVVGSRASGDSEVVTLPQIIAREATAASLKPELVEALIQIESKGDPQAIRFEPHLLTGTSELDRLKASSHGLLQVLGSWVGKCPDIGTWADLYEPSKNIRCGVHILKSELDRTGSVRRALIGYNGGARCELNQKCLSQAGPYADKVMAALTEKMYSRAS